MRNNVCKGLARIATIESSKGIAPFSVNAVNNYFQGRTTLSCNNVERLDLNFRNNTFDCNYPVFFLQNFAKTGKVLFNNNKVTVSTGNGTFMYPPAGKASTSSMKFERLEIMGNEFHGIKSQNEMVDNITNVKKRKIKSNAFYSK